ncbi:hypothetical protein ACH6EH_16720 [Paenibacillus sp. JSM ZJ436]|uniref:hypothetical protein n=1 Tax=Paenibacillus sp. JSM ZJ436 TaxID=3376190 RepID=UPI0037A99978
MMIQQQENLTLLLDEYIAEVLPSKLWGKSKQLERMRIQRFLDFMLSTWCTVIDPIVIERWIDYMSRRILRKGNLQYRQLEEYRAAVMKFYLWTLERKNVEQHPESILSETQVWTESRKFMGNRGIRPLRDKTILIMIHTMEIKVPQLISLNIEDVNPADPNLLRESSVTTLWIKGISYGTRKMPRELAYALADYLEHERHRDVTIQATDSPLFLNSIEIPNRSPTGRLSLGNVYRICRKLR